ncbi:MAG TPA: ATP-binding protein [Acidobacteriaceae bacterium]|jgi:PAS domain S-box-containing protein|nr:ATP-binding protein [Acidobacteriaceae bacterium]
MTADEKVNILMVDDQPAKLLSYEVILGDLGENLIKAASAREALNILLKTDIAVVLMDVSMPELDGFELADMIREHPRFGKTAIIFISGVHLTDVDRINGYRRGAVDYISVPVIPEVLRAKIGVFVELHRKTRLLERLNTDLERRVEDRTEELRQSEAHHRERAELLELATEAIIVRDLNGAIRFWNSGAESLYGWHRDEVLGRNLHELLRTVFPVSPEETEHLLQNNRSWHGNLTMHTKDGRELVVATRKVFNREGDAVLEIQRDITSQMQAEEALRQAEKLAAMGRVAGIIAHEINNPLEAITNAFYLLRNHPSLDQEARYYASLAEQELQRAAHITRQTLSFYRDSKQPITVALPDLLDNVVELQQRSITVNRIVLEKKYTCAGVVRGFPGELRQVFLNLIGNAIQAMPTGGTLRLRVAEVTDQDSQRRGVAISVIDTGNGIRPEDARRLFQPFFTTKSAKGTGLGLWISRGIVQKYEGRIDFRSLHTASGACTCFRVFLPSSGDVSAGEPGKDQESASLPQIRAIA